MTRNVLLVLAVFAAALSIRAAEATELPRLRAEAVVGSEVVRLGDLIENAGPVAVVPVFHAPPLGQSGTLQVHRVLDAALANGLLAVDTAGLHEIQVIRAVRTVSLAEIEAAVMAAALRQFGHDKPEDVALQLNRHVQALRIEPDATAAPRVTEFRYDPRSRRFDALLDVPGSAILRRDPARISGTIVETAEVVTLARALSRGETVRDSDVAIERRPREQVAPDAITRTAAVIGMAARRPLRAGQPLRRVDLMKPDLVARDDAVTIRFETTGILLTARGKALAAGAEGELVPVLNEQSKRVVQGRVEARGLVSVGRPASTEVAATQ